MENLKKEKRREKVRGGEGGREKERKSSNKNRECHFSFSLMKYRLRMNESIWIERDPLEQISVVGIAPLKVV